MDSTKQFQLYLCEVWRQFLLLVEQEFEKFSEVLGHWAYALTDQAMPDDWRVQLQNFLDAWEHEQGTIVEEESLPVLFDWVAALARVRGALPRDPNVVYPEDAWPKFIYPAPNAPTHSAVPFSVTRAAVSMGRDASGTKEAVQSRPPEPATVGPVEQNKPASPSVPKASPESTTYTTSLGQKFTVSGDFTESAVAEALYLASIILAKERQLVEIAAATENYHRSLANQSLGFMHFLILDIDHARRQVRALEQQREILTNEILRLRKLFGEKGYDQIIWSGQFGDDLQLFSGTGFEGAIRILAGMHYAVNDGLRDVTVDTVMTVLAAASLARFTAGLGIKIVRGGERLGAEAGAGAIGVNAPKALQTPSNAELAALGNIPEKQGLTNAGKSLAKHGSGKRVGSNAFPNPKGNQAQINAQARNVLDEILSDSARTVIQRPGRPGEQLLQISRPDGTCVIYKWDGAQWQFSHFAENLH